MTDTDLRAEFTAWCQAQGIEPFEPTDPGLSAEALISEFEYAVASSNDPLEIGTMIVQKRWLRDFLERWDTVP